MGNVGQHYYKWRYIVSAVTPTPTATSTPIVTPTPTAVPTSTPVPGPTTVPPNGLNVNPSTGPVGQKFQITGTGFGVNETVNVWETDPSMTVNGLPGVTTDATGKFTFTYVGHSPAGTYTITAHGNSSNVEKLSDIVVTGSGSGTSTPAPSSGSLAVNPASGLIGQKFQITGTGFGANETVNVWETDPSIAVHGLPGVVADANGKINFIYESHSPAGVYTITAHGNSSGVEKLTDVTVLASGTPAPSNGFLDVTPASGKIGQKFQITGTGFAPGEIVTMWETDPTMTVNGLPAITTDDKGKFIITYVGHAPAGTYTVTGHGNSSGVEKLCDIVVLK
jgi:hypothetical protein